MPEDLNEKSYYKKLQRHLCKSELLKMSDIDEIFKTIFTWSVAISLILSSCMPLFIPVWGQGLIIHFLS